LSDNVKRLRVFFQALQASLKRERRAMRFYRIRPGLTPSMQGSSREALKGTLTR